MIIPKQITIRSSLLCRGFCISCKQYWTGERLKFLLFHLICHIYTKQVILIHVSKLLKYHIFIIHPIHINNDIKFILIGDILKGLAKTTLQSFFAIYTITVSNIISFYLLHADQSYNTTYSCLYHSVLAPNFQAIHIYIRTSLRETHLIVFATKKIRAHHYGSLPTLPLINTKTK